MDEDCLKAMEKLVPVTYIRQAADIAKGRNKKLRTLLEQRKLPSEGWDDLSIEQLLNQLSGMDSNNFPSNCGAGEREGRFASQLVAKRHYRLSHGIGRSGDLTESQPKAAGSSLMYKLTNELLKDLMCSMGMEPNIECLLVPVATGMSLVLSLMALRSLQPQKQYVVWSRIDQKACFKSIVSTGFIPIIIDCIHKDNELSTDLEEMEKKIVEYGPKNILCIISTTSCFAPRNCDDVEEIAKLAKRHDIYHLINNAYGLQSKYLMNRILKARRKGNVEIFVQSTDKNLMVPVGGAIVCTFDKNLLERISSLYPGRASASPVLDVFMTLLSLGKNGYLKLVEDRLDVHKHLFELLSEFVSSVGEFIIMNSANPIAIAITLRKIPEKNLTKLGSMLFLRGVSGTRVVTGKDIKSIDGHRFIRWGSHTSQLTLPYLTCAVSIGMTKEDADVFVQRLECVYKKSMSDTSE